MAEKSIKSVGRTTNILFFSLSLPYLPHPKNKVMNNSLSHLPPQTQQSILAITRLIQKTINPEKIILFGVHAESVADPALHLYSSVRPQAASIDILVITRTDDTRQDFKLQDILVHRSRSHGPSTFIVHDMPYVNHGLAAGQPFFYKIIKGGILLHDAGTTPLGEPMPPNFSQLANLARRNFAHRFHQANGFLKSARFNQQEKEYSLAMFLLHQAAEHAYEAILTVLTGYGPTTHNLDKLRRYSDRYSVELANIFPCSTERETDLFKWLMNAYVDARYKGEYPITAGQLRQLLERVTRLHSIAERLCHDHIISLENRAGAVLHCA
jgi:HEPN domain-containing protein